MGSPHAADAGGRVCCTPLLHLPLLTATLLAQVVGSAVSLQQPEAVVYEVTHTGYVRMKRDPGKVGGWEDWQLDCSPGKTGVSWFADSDD
jgi:hypothetical protein